MTAWRTRRRGRRIDPPRPHSRRRSPPRTGGRHRVQCKQECTGCNNVPASVCLLLRNPERPGVRRAPCNRLLPQGAHAEGLTPGCAPRTVHGTAACASRAHCVLSTYCAGVPAGAPCRTGTGTPACAAWHDRVRIAYATGDVSVRFRYGVARPCAVVARAPPTGRRALSCRTGESRSRARGPTADATRNTRGPASPTSTR